MNGEDARAALQDAYLATAHHRGPISARINAMVEELKRLGVVLSEAGEPASAKAVMLAVRLQETPTVLRSFLIMPGDTAAISLKGYIEGPDGPSFVSVPVEITASLGAPPR